MAIPIRLDETLLSAAEKAGSIQKRSIPKQIEFWAELGKTVEHVINLEDIFAILQGTKRIIIEPSPSAGASSKKVFDAVEKHRKKTTLPKEVTSAVVVYEASRTVPGMLDRVDSVTGQRQTGMFRNGEFIPK